VCPTCRLLLPRGARPAGSGQLPLPQHRTRLRGGPSNDVLTALGRLLWGGWPLRRDEGHYLAGRAPDLRWPTPDAWPSYLLFTRGASHQPMVGAWLDVE
jgi:hypothetical protein